MTTTYIPEIHRFKLGPMIFTSIRDGSGTLEKPWETFGVDQSPETVQAELKKNFLPTETLINSYTPVVIETGSEVILVDTGFGAAMREKGAGKLLSNMKAAGYTPEHVTLVILTHLHGDHIGGLMEDGKPAFPNARYVTGKIEYEFWTDKAREGTPAEGNHKMVMSNVVPFKDKITLLKDGDTVIPGIKAHMAPGHTPGHMIFDVESDGKRLILSGDTANHYVLSVGHPDWEVRFDMDKKQAAQTRHKVLGMIADDRIPFLGYHMPYPAVGFIERNGDGFRYVAKSYQLDL